ncbi:MAG: hypothetical protein GYB67_05540 [Chloroflexi bacterium]|nr:hypothetical protein [Chloroflexota bacterium]
MIKQVRMIVAILIGLIPALTTVYAEPERIAAIEDQLRVAVAALPGMRAVLEVEAVPVAGDGDRFTVAVTYQTEELSEFGYHAEIVDVFQVIGAAVEAGELDDIDAVTVLPAVVFGEMVEPIERLRASVEMIEALARGAVTRSAFLVDLERAPGAHQQAPPAGDNI